MASPASTIRCMSSGVRISAGISRPRGAAEDLGHLGAIEQVGGQPVILARVRLWAFDPGPWPRPAAMVVTGDPADLLVSHRPHHLACTAGGLIVSRFSMNTCGCTLAQASLLPAM